MIVLNAEGETYYPRQREFYSQQFVVQSGAFLSVSGPIKRPSIPWLATPNGEIAQYIESIFGTKDAVQIAVCESGLKSYAYNPELYAKARNITRYSSCGIFQHNDPRCEDKNSELYNWKYNIDLAYEKYLNRGWQPWLSCSRKYNLI